MYIFSSLPYRNPSTLSHGHIKFGVVDEQRSGLRVRIRPSKATDSESNFGDVGVQQLSQGHLPIRRRSDEISIRCVRPVDTGKLHFAFDRFDLISGDESACKVQFEKVAPAFRRCPVPYIGVYGSCREDTPVWGLGNEVFRDGCLADVDHSEAVAPVDTAVGVWNHLTLSIFKFARCWCILVTGYFPLKLML